MSQIPDKLAAAELRVKREPDAEPSSAPEIPVRPPDDAIAAMAAVNGGNADYAAHQLFETAKQSLAKVRLLNPSKFAEAARQIEIIADASAEYYRIANDSFNAIAEVEKLLIARGAALQQAAAKTAALHDAISALESADSMELEGGELLSLAAKKRHLPAAIETLRAEAATAEGEAVRFAGAANLDIDQILEAMQSANRSPEGRIQDGEIQRLFDAGVMKISAVAQS